jgi:hypothetical protein
MNTLNQTMNPDDGSTESNQKIMISGYVFTTDDSLFSVEIKRGMAMLSKEGREVGKAAAVILNSKNGKATHILLSRLPEISGYWLVAVDLIEEVDQGKIILLIPETALVSLPRWHPM